MLLLAVPLTAMRTSRASVVAPDLATVNVPGFGPSSEASASVAAMVITEAGAGCAQAENSEVSFAPLVVVAVTICSAATGKTGVVALPSVSVVTVVAPSNVAPSPLPDASHAVLPKYSIRNVLLGVLCRVPCTPPDAAVRTRKFCRLLAPVSVSPASLGVTPSGPRSMPSSPFPEIALDTIALLVPLSTRMPCVPLNRMTLPLTPLSVASLPMTVSCAPSVMNTPAVPLPS